MCFDLVNYGSKSLRELFFVFCFFRTYIHYLDTLLIHVHRMFWLSLNA